MILGCDAGWGCLAFECGWHVTAKWVVNDAQMIPACTLVNSQRTLVRQHCGQFESLFIHHLAHLLNAP